MNRLETIANVTPTTAFGHADELIAEGARPGAIDARPRRRVVQLPRAT